MIEVRDLSKLFPGANGPKVAVDAIRFTVRPGEVFGLLGPNGAGKTTTLRMLCTVLKPTGGTATVAGYDVETQPSEVRRHVGFLSANTGVYDRMTAWEMVEYYGRLHDLPPELLQSRMDELFTTLQMNDFRDVPGSKMSTGMKQKVSIARALVNDPPVLIFDEPTSGPGRAGPAGRAGEHQAATRPRQDHPLLDAHHARGREAVRSRGDHGAGQDRRLRHSGRPPADVQAG